MSEEQNGGRGGLDDALQREIDEALGGKSLEELLGDTVPTARKGEENAGPVSAGQIRKARVASISGGFALVELGGKDQGMVPLDQFEKVPEVGAQLELSVSRFDRTEDLWVLSREGAVEHATWDSLQEGTIVEAMVEGLNKGGLEVKFNGIKAFMPISQISLYRVEDASEFLRQKLKCQVVEVRKREKRVIVSARAVQELEAQEKKERLLAELKEGDVREGIVRQVMPYGAFVDMGGVDGLVHVSQMSHARIDDPTKVVKPGEKVQVKVLKIDRETNKISLGMKQVMPDPWDAVETKYPVGSQITGRVVKLENFGAFYELEPGLEGLIPISELTWTGRPKHPSELLSVGQLVGTVVLSVDKERRRVSLSIKQAQANPWSGAEQRYLPDSEVTGRVTRIVEFGAFVELEPGIEGLVHISELSDDRVRRVEDAVQVGQTLRVKILDISEQARRVSLSKKAIRDESAAAPAEAAPAAAPAPQKKRKAPLKGGLDR